MNQPYTPLLPWLLAALLWPAILPFPWTTNTGEFALVAVNWAGGDLLYVDVGSIRPVGLFAIWRLGLALFGRDHAHVVMDLLVQVVTLAGVTHLGRRFWGKAAGIRAGILYAVSAFAYLMPDTVSEAETFCMPLIVAAILIADRARERPDVPRWMPFLLLGVLGAQMAALKIVPALLAAAVAGWLIGCRRDAGLARPAAGFAAGFVLGLLPWVLLLLPGGSLPAMVDMFVRWRGPAGNVGLLRWLLTPPTLLLGVLYFIPAGILALLAFPRLRRARDPSTPDSGVPGDAARGATRHPADRLLWIVIAAGLVVVAVQGKFYGYHYILVLPALALLGGRWWQIVRDEDPPAPSRAKRALSGALALFLVLGPFVRRGEKWVGAAAYAAGTKTRAEYLAQFKVDTLADPVADEAMARRLARETAAGARVLVWGITPQVLYLADRKPASRFVMHLPYACRACDPSLKDELLERLRADPPARILVHFDELDATDIGEKVTAGALFDRFTGLRTFVDEQYELAYREGPYDVYRLRPRPVVDRGSDVRSSP